MFYRYLKYVGERKLLVSYLLHDIILFNSRLTSLSIKNISPRSVSCCFSFLIILHVYWPVLIIICITEEITMKYLNDFLTN